MATDEKTMSVSHHNASDQVDVSRNPDPALDTANEHHHSHLHHSDFAEKGHHHEIAYTTGTTFEPSMIPDSERERRTNAAHGHLDDKMETNVLDEEKDGSVSPTSDSGQPPADRSWARFYAKYKLWVHLVIFLFFTGWWIASLILHRNDKNWEIPFLLWLAITIRLVTFHVPAAYVLRAGNYVWQRTAIPFNSRIPEKWRIPAAALLAIAVICIGAFVSPESADNTRANRAVSLFGLAVFIFAMWATSRNRSKIQWHTVIVGMLAQFIVALFVLRTGVGYDIFNFISQLARELLGFAEDGVAFLTSEATSELTWFLITVLPAVIFFVSIVSVLYYWGVLQWFIGKFASFFFWSMRVSGAEAVVAAASPFIGQGESAMLIKPFIAHLTKAELHQIMTSGFATISGSVLIGYIGLGVNGTALISSCVMSIPASLALSKLRWPETEETLTAGRVVIPDDDEHRAVNTLHAFANGAWLGIRIAGTILSTILCIIAAVGLINGLLGWWGSYINIDNPSLSLQLILGYICYPIAFLLGVPRDGDLYKVGQLIGEKIIENEFVAYTDLQKNPEFADLSSRSRLIATYALCGFANIGSLGTQIGILSQLAPGRSGDVARIAFSALITGALSTLTSASIAGMLVTDQAAFTAPTS